MINFFNNISYFLTNASWAFWTLITLLGLVFGSFLNLVIYRLPIMLENEWKREGFIKKYLLPFVKEAPFNLAFPPSHCPKCKHEIPIWCNIPIISFLILRGKCFHCKAPISIRYPLVEILIDWVDYLCYEFFPVTVVVLLVLLVDVLPRLHLL